MKRCGGRSMTWEQSKPKFHRKSLGSSQRFNTYIEPITITIDDLKIRLDKTWNSFSINLLEKLSESFKNRIDQMMTNKGRFSKY